MILFPDAIHQIISTASPVPEEQVAYERSLGRVLSSKILSPEALPPFTNSAMDGFAVSSRHIASQSGPFRMRVNGIIAAGDAVREHCETGPNECWEIMTGAVVPPDCDAVIKVEETTREGDTIQFSRLVRAGENIRKAGEDFQMGKEVSDGGTRVYPEHLMSFAALGINSVSVYRKPTVAVVSTGAELTSDAGPGTGKIRNSTAPYLLSELNALGVDARFLGVIADDPKAFLSLMETELGRNVDVILSTGAVSMGRYDFVAPALRDLGAEILFHKVAIRPGKPLLFAKLGKTAFFGVPGNPVSTAVGLRFFVEPYLRSLQGLSPERPYRAVLENDTKKPLGLRCFFKAEVSHTQTLRTVKILRGQESFRVAPCLASNCWAVLPEDGDSVVNGSEIDIYPLHSWSSKEGIL
ncbi:MAG: molybdopterin molybdotransferase MoeA [Bdellovibrionaceae bacterium]|nr:molybdopterin molybdotransferase MoeA [Pseudobdellovibrionaceae bacterium]